MKKIIVLVLLPLVIWGLTDLQYFQSAVQEGKEGLAEAMYAGLETKYQKAATNAFKAKFTRDPKIATGPAQKIEASTPEITAAIEKATTKEGAIDALKKIASTTGKAVADGLKAKGASTDEIRSALAPMLT